VDPDDCRDIRMLRGNLEKVYDNNDGQRKEQRSAEQYGMVKVV